MPRPPTASPRDWRFAILASSVVVVAGLVAWHWRELAQTSPLAPKSESENVADELAKRAAETIEPTRAPMGEGATESAIDAATAEEAAPALTVRFFDPLGQPVERFVGALLLDDGPPSELERRVGGRMTAPVPTSAGEVVVWCGTLLPTRAPVAAGATALDIAAASGATLSGRITVGGQPWGEPLECVLREQEGDRQTRYELEELLPESLREDLPDRIDVPVASDGSFAVHGLDRDSWLTLDAPSGFSFKPLSRTPDGHLDPWEGDDVELDGPRMGVELDLVALPALTGRIVAPMEIDDVQATLTFHTRRASGDSRDETIGEYLNGEQFRIVLYYVRWDSLDLALRAEDVAGNVVGFARRTIVRRTPGVIELGDIELETGPTFRFRMHDDSGAAVDKALVSERRDGRSGPFSSWAEGPDGTIGPYAPWVDELVFRPDDLEPLVVPIAGRGDGDLLDLVFTRGSELVVRFRRPDDEPPSDLVLELAAEQPLFSDDRAVQGDEGGSASTTLWRVVIGRTRGDDPCHVDGILPGVRFRVRLLDWIGAPRCEQWLELAARERREITLTPDAIAKPVRIAIVDAENRPVAEADVEVRNQPDRDARYEREETDHHGIASFGPSAFQVMWVDVDPPWRYAPRRLVPITLPKDGSAVRLVVERAWKLQVEPGPSQLELDELPWVVGHESDASWMAWPATEDAWHFRAIPPLPCTVCLRYAGRVFSLPVAPPTERLRFELPAVGQVVVRYDLPLPDALLRGRLLRGVTLVPIDEPTTLACEVSAEATLWEPPRREGAVEFRAVLPGRYRVVLRWDEERPGLHLDDDEEERPLEKTERDETEAELVVKASETTEASVRR